MICKTSHTLTFDIQNMSYDTISETCQTPQHNKTQNNSYQVSLLGHEEKNQTMQLSYCTIQLSARVREEKLLIRIVIS